MIPSAASHCVLVIDQGSHASRAMVYDQELNLLAQASEPVQARHPAHRQVEYQASQLLDTTRRVIHQAVRQSGRLPACAGLATQRSTIVCWTLESGEPVGPALSWQDTRAPLPPGLDAEQVRRITGLQPSQHYGAAKLKWCLEHWPGEFVAGPLASFLIHGLCQERPLLVDPCNASRTLLFDSQARRWSSELLDQFGIPEHILPCPVPNRHDYGLIETHAGAIPLTVVSGDQSCVPFASGPLEPGSVWIQLGTGAFVQRMSEKPVDRLLHSVIWDDGQRVLRVCEGTVNGAAAAIDWYCREQKFETEGNLARAAALMGRDDLSIFINAVGGLGSPDWQADMASRFVQPASGIPGLAAVLESVVFLVHRNLERMGDGIKALHLSGGLSRLDPVCQSLADLSGVGVHRVEAEATALGMAALLLNRIDGFVQSGKPFQPGCSGNLGDRYQSWSTQMPALADPLTD